MNTPTEVAKNGGWLRAAVKSTSLVVGLVVYSSFGGVIFRRLEESGQLKRWSEEDEFVERHSQQLSNEIVAAIGDGCNCKTNNGMTSQESLEKIGTILSDFGKGVMQDKKRSKERYRWTANNAMWYSVTLITTIGYGRMVCETFWGRLVTILYAFLGVPYTLIVLAQIGDNFATALLFFWNNHLRTKNAIKQLFTGSKTSFHKTTSVPILLATLFVVSYMMLCAAVVYKREKDWDYFTAFYFIFITQMTIGLGDVMPSNTDWANSFSINCGMLLGLALVSMCFQVVQKQWNDTHDTPTPNPAPVIHLKACPESAEHRPAHAHE